MASTEAYADQTWQWIDGALKPLKEECQSSPGLPWSERQERFLSNLGLRDPSEHSVVQLLVETLEQQFDDDAAREAFLVGNEVDTNVYGWAYQAAEQYVPVAAPDQNVDLVGSDVAAGAVPASAEISYADSSYATVEPGLSQSTDVELLEAPQVVDEIVMPALIQALADVPEAAGLSDEEISQVLQEVLNDLGQPSVA